MQADGLSPGSAAYVAAMEACARGGVMDLALELLDRVLQDHPGDEAVMYLYVQVVFWQRGSLACFALHERSACLLHVPHSDYSNFCRSYFPTAITCSELAQTCHASNSLFLQTITAGYSGAIRATANGGQWEEATSLLQRMRQDSLAVVTSEEYNAAILACVRAQQAVAALTLLGNMSLEAKSCKADETSYILVMRAFGREGR